ncbi:MAG: hypothetical protein DCF25_22205 [Leptolyngbya foveolarum]|uniref:Uncharacterized protein n=1 Tax=Leptolyngbya foveolarum TaxID=47253 RepID=A0A2W4VFU3_9CYAN|nr:MAG: hypothetical protein DCF25_22205 [Leptolyngbya foveolarum]
MQELERANAHAVRMQKSRRDRTARRKFVQAVKASAYHNRFTIGLSLIVALTFLVSTGFQAIQSGLFNVDAVSTQADGYPE